jgi:penicillin-binding protein 1C
VRRTQSKTQTTTFFAQTKTALINHLLSNNASGAGRLHGRIKRQAIAYKTGTGPGGSDAWDIGTNGDYVVGIWIGSPKGEHVAQNTGLSEAVPVMNRVFDGLPKGELNQFQPGNPSEALATFERKQSERLTIEFPEEGSVIEYRGAGIPLPLVVKNATYPLLAVVNNVEKLWLYRGHSGLRFSEQGSYKVALVDAKGQQGVVRFVLRQPQ